MSVPTSDQGGRVGLLSLVVVHYEIPREFPRTLHSLAPTYQQGIGADEYEVIVVDNGSSRPPDLGPARDLGLDVHLITVDEPRPSPAHAINVGLNATCGSHVGVMIDGARLASPGLLATARQALGLSRRAVVGSRGRYLGPKPQRESMHEGYTREVEDELLASVDWTADGYRLFDISVFDESSGPHWFKPPAESNSIFMSRRMWRELGGYAEVFDEPGGGYVNLDTWRRACLLPGALPVVLLGEATFHQLHGGVATNAPKEETARMRARYTEVRGEEYSVPPVQLHYFGAVPQRPPVHELGLTSTEHRKIAVAYNERRAANAAAAAGGRPRLAERLRANATAVVSAPGRAYRSARSATTRRVRSIRRGRRRAVNRLKRGILALPGARPVWNRLRDRIR